MRVAGILCKFQFHFGSSGNLRQFGASVNVFADCANRRSKLSLEDSNIRLETVLRCLLAR